MTMTEHFDIKTVTRKRYNYSNRERAILKALGRPGRKVTSTQLIERVYGEDKPVHARPAMLTMISILIKKVQHNREGFTIKRTSGRGPVAHTFWLELDK